MQRGRPRKSIEVAPTASGILVPTAPFMGSNQYVNEVTGKIEFACVKREVTDGVEVYRKDGEYVRKYSLDVHGKDYAKLADEFVSKKNKPLM